MLYWRCFSLFWLDFSPQKLKHYCKWHSYRPRLNNLRDSVADGLRQKPRALSALRYHARGEKTGQDPNKRRLNRGGEPPWLQARQDRFFPGRQPLNRNELIGIKSTRHVVWVNWWRGPHPRSFQRRAKWDWKWIQEPKLWRDWQRGRWRKPQTSFWKIRHLDQRMIYDIFSTLFD